MKLIFVALVATSMVLFAAEQKPKMRTIAKGAFSGVEEQTGVLVTNQTQWAELWKRHSAKELPSKAAPEVDFNKESVLFVTLGTKPTGGYAVEIAEVKKTEDKTEVIVKTRAPQPGGFQIQALTGPFQIVAIPKITGPARFVFEKP